MPETTGKKTGTKNENRQAAKFRATNAVNEPRGGGKRRNVGRKVTPGSRPQERVKQRPD